jgi:hypothetical protein
MGVMGWTEEQTLRTTVPAIEAAYKGRCDFVSMVLKAVFGTNEPEAPKVSARPFSFALFDAQFGGDR